MSLVVVTTNLVDLDNCNEIVSSDMSGIQCWIFTEAANASLRQAE
jgi:hypothetical protein